MTKNGEVLKIDIGKTQDLEECCAFGREMFRAKPLSLFLTNDVLKNMDFVKPWTLGCLRSNVSLVARNSGGSVVAVRMSELSTVDKPTEMPKEVTDAAGHVLGKLNEGFNIFEMFQVRRFIHFVYLGVDQKYRRQGLAEKMFAISTELAKLNGAEAIVVDGINKHATQAAIKSGFKVINTLDCSTIKDTIPPQNFPQLMNDNPELCLLIRSLN